ncbi:MAG: hypothetical protein DRQ49_02635 [Gammaproteobacteria bacterium]|nr:MAG: hypothetical protein DRQ41_08860 [Gammaproteobacteria bacterium]RKZ42227.1 MAG: hypothetical protein DRQ49_02635 [Gammaproteobacteria bacterium]RKZ76329.1 MAG: hypothetical protein DRQ57_04245 [Gammaproteobacteria bacterium]
MKTNHCKSMRWFNRSYLVLVPLLGLLLGSIEGSAETIEATLTFEGHTDSVNNVAISNDGSQVLSGSYDNTMKLWDVETGNVIHTFQGHTDFVMSVAFSSDAIALSGSADNTIRRWNIETGKNSDTFQQKIGWIYSIAFSPNSNRAILSGSRDNAPRLLNTLKGTEIDSFQGHTNWVHLVAISNDSQKVFSATDDGTMKVWDVESGKAKTINENDQIWAAAFSPDGSKILSGNAEGVIKLFDSESGKEIRAFNGHSARVDSIAFSPEGNQAVSGGHDGTIKVWDIDSGEEIHILKGHTDIVSSVVFSPNGSQILSGSYDNTLKLWDMIPTTCTSSCIQIEGLEDAYTIGTELVMRLVETGERSELIDLWLAIVLPDNEMLFVTSFPAASYSLSPQPFKSAVESSAKTHALLDIQVSPGTAAGEYTFYALYVKKGKNPFDGEGVWLSNLAQKKVMLE